jgi:hypothetical protein
MAGLRATTAIVPVADIDVRGWDEIWRLTSRFYDADRPHVERRLRSQQAMALFRSHPARALVGMAAIDEDVFSFEGRRVVVTFTSHTLIDPRYRGLGLLQRLGAKCIVQSWLKHPLKRRFWAFDTVSARGYLLLPRNLASFWPRHDKTTPPWEARFMAEYGQRQYGAAWRGDGIVRRQPQMRLLPNAAALRGATLRAPEVAFFEQRNAGHGEGDALFCLVPLTLANGWRLLCRVLARRLLGG